MIEDGDISLFGWEIGKLLWSIVSLGIRWMIGLLKKIILIGNGGLISLEKDIL